MTSDVRGLEQLEGAVLDSSVSLASALRRCLMLGGYAHHQELRAWALKELVGYTNDDELPDYRKVPAALEVILDHHMGGSILKNDVQRISHIQLPKQARDRGIGESAPIMYGVKQMEELVARSDKSVHLAPPGSAEYALIMTALQATAGNDGTNIKSLHWSVAVASLEGVLDHVRTRLTQFVAEVRASMPPGQQDPIPAQIGDAAEKAFNITAGDNATVNINAPKAHADNGGTASANINDPASPAQPATAQPFWHRTSVLWTAAGAIATIATAVIAWLALK
ncbi:AbiTii domain-containing protein [Streptomyces sp. NPDC055663]